jgi:hypothetical protein
MKYYVVFTNGMAMLYYEVLTRDRLALGEVVFVKLLSEPAKGICPSSDCDGSVIHSRMRMGGWSERMVGDQLDDRANDPQDICQRLVVYFISIPERISTTRATPHFIWRTRRLTN